MHSRALLWRRIGPTLLITAGWSVAALVHHRFAEITLLTEARYICTSQVHWLCQDSESSSGSDGQQTAEQWSWPLWCKFGFRKCAWELLLGPARVGHQQWSQTVHFFSSHVTIQSRNGSLLLCRITEDNASKWWFLRHPLTNLFHLPICFKCPIIRQWLVLSSLATSHVVVRGSASIILSIGHCQLHACLVFKALFFAKLGTPLHCRFVSSSRANCFVDVTNCLRCFRPILNLNKTITLICFLFYIIFLDENKYKI